MASGLKKQKKYNWKETNLSLFGSDLEKKVQKPNSFRSPRRYLHRSRRLVHIVKTHGKGQALKSDYRYGGSSNSRWDPLLCIIEILFPVVTCLKLGDPLVQGGLW